MTPHGYVDSAPPNTVLLNYSKGAKRGKTPNKQTKKKIKGIPQSLNKAAGQKKTSPHNENAAALSSCWLHQSALGRNGEKCQRKETRDLATRFKQVKNHAHGLQNSSARFPPVPLSPVFNAKISAPPQIFPGAIPACPCSPWVLREPKKKPKNHRAADPTELDTAPQAATPGRRSPWRSRRCPPRL